MLDKLENDLNGVVLYAGSLGVKFLSCKTAGDVKIETKAEYKGWHKEMVACANRDYLLHAFELGFTELRFSDACSPFVFKGEAGLYVFMLTGHGIKEIRAKYATKEKAEMENALLLHGGERRVSRDELKEVLTPKPTMSWKPVPHYEVAEYVAHIATRRGYNIVSEEYGLSPTGRKMFGVLKFAPEGNPEYTRALGIRNSHDKSFALGLVVGVNVMVCSNLAC
jgi:hypothetical protein